MYCVTAETEHFSLMENYEPFGFDDGEALFSLSIESSDEAPEFVEEIRQEDEGQEIICGKTTDGKPVFEYRWWHETAGWLVCSEDYHEGRLLVTGRCEKMAIDNALMVQFAMATADQGTALFHAAVVSYEGGGYMFLGPSGTGKSTHASLWLKHIEGVALVNDDNPVVRDGIVYGSPWSGKTPCYRNVSYPLLALNETAAWLWKQALEIGDFTMEQLAKRLCEEYEVTADEAKADVSEIIAEWQKVDVVE